MNILQPPNAVFFVGLVAYFWTRHCFIQFTKGEQKTVQHVDTSEKLLLAAVSVTVLLLPLLYLFTPLLSFADYHLAWYVRWCGIAVMLLSLWLFWRSHVDLGKNWSVSLEIRENHEIVSNGVYRRIRHPMCASIWLWAIAQGLTLGNWLAGWALLPAFAAMYFIRTPREERMMVEQFGESYQQYCRQTGRLIPRLVTSVDSTQATPPENANIEPTLLEEISISGFDPDGEPIIKLWSDGSLWIHFEAMPPFFAEDKGTEADFENFDEQIHAALGVEVIRDDRESFVVQQPASDTAERVKEWLERFHEIEGS